MEFANPCTGWVKLLRVQEIKGPLLLNGPADVVTVALIEPLSLQGCPPEAEQFALDSRAPLTLRDACPLVAGPEASWPPIKCEPALTWNEREGNSVAPLYAIALNSRYFFP